MSAPILHQLDFVAGAATALALNALWEGALLALCVYLLLRLWPGLNAATRYLIWSATLIAAVVVPIGTTLPFLATSTPASSAVHTPGLTHAQTRSARPLRVPAQQPYRTQTQPAPALAPALRRMPPSTATYSVPSARLPQRFYLTVPVQLALAVLAIWALIALFSLARLAVGLLKLETLKRNALPLPIEYRDDMRRWNQASKGSRPVRLCVSDDVDVPVAVGLFDAMILIPRELLKRLSHAEVDQISLHELAHLRRADDWSNGLHRVVLALFAWNPAALFIGRQLDLEREVACDDCVLALTGMVRPYALTLTKMAETSAVSYRPVPAPGVFATRKQISLRIERLLGAGRNAATNLSLGPAAATIAIVAVLAFAMQLIAPSIAAPAGHAGGVTASAKPPVESAKTPVEKPMTREHFVYVRVAQTATASAATEPVAGTAGASASPASIASPNESQSKPGTKLKVVQTEVRIPATHVHVPARKFDFPAIDVEVPGQTVKLPKFGNFPKFVGDAVQSSLTVAGVGSASAASLAHASAASALAHADAAAGVRVADGAPVRSCNACDLSDVDWSGRDLRNASYVGSDFSRAKLQGTDFSGGNFSGVDFSHANLRSASFRNAKLTGCDFSNADLTGADFTGATLGGCEFTHALLPAAQMHAVLNTCTGCDFSHADLRGQDLSNVHARAIDFSHANLEGANLAGSQFVGTDFSGANLNNANFNGTLLSGCDLAGVDLTHVDLSRAKLVGTDLSSGRKPHP